MGASLAVCVASRGVGHIRAMASLVREVQGLRPRWCWAFALPIPAAQNEVTRQALASGADLLWFVEDDVLLPPGVLRAMLAAAREHAIVTVDYLGRHGRGLIARHPVSGEVVVTPMGCLLVRREVFERIPSPPWQVQGRWVLDGGEWRETGGVEHYGGHDGHFSREVRKAGFEIHQLAGWQCGHLDVVRLAHRDARSNVGQDEERCFGGDGLPLRPAGRWKEDNMAVEFWRSPGGTVIDLDPEQGADIGQYERQGWTRITATEARPVIKAQQQQSDQVMAADRAAREVRS